MIFLACILHGPLGSCRVIMQVRYMLRYGLRDYLLWPDLIMSGNIMHGASHDGMGRNPARDVKPCARLPRTGGDRAMICNITLFSRRKCEFHAVPPSVDAGDGIVATWPVLLLEHSALKTCWRVASPVIGNTGGHVRPGYGGMPQALSPYVLIYFGECLKTHH